MAVAVARRALRLPDRRRIYLKAGQEREKTAVLVVLGVRADGRKELLAMEEGYRESTASWAEVLRELRDRGMDKAPLVAVGDGASACGRRSTRSSRPRAISAAGTTAP